MFWICWPINSGDAVREESMWSSFKSCARVRTELKSLNKIKLNLHATRMLRFTSEDQMSLCVSPVLGVVESVIHHRHHHVISCHLSVFALQNSQGWFVCSFGLVCNYGTPASLQRKMLSEPKLVWHISPNVPFHFPLLTRSLMYCGMSSPLKWTDLFAESSRRPIVFDLMACWVLFSASL